MVLVESGDRLLDSFAPALSRAASHGLQQLGVEIAWRNRVTEIRPGYVMMQDASGTTSRVEAKTIIWAAGVRGGAVGESLAESLGRDDILDRGRRVIVDKRCMVPGVEDVYVIGDLAAFRAHSGSLLPGVAPVALQQGRRVGRRIRRQLAGRSDDETFSYSDRGSMATIGRSHAVAEIGRVRLSGRAAWLLWLLVHVLSLARFENRLLVSMPWFWHYATHNRSTRLITEGRESSFHVTPSETTPRSLRNSSRSHELPASSAMTERLPWLAGARARAGFGSVERRTAFGGPWPHHAACQLSAPVDLDTLYSEKSLSVCLDGPWLS